MEVTPELAKDWLNTKRRGNNRKLSQTHIQQYAKDMVAGRWVPNNDAIAFDTEGFLLNGHHRLEACTLAGVPFRTFIHQNLSHDSFITMDVAAKRNMADALNLSGVKEHEIIGPALSWLWRFQSGRMTGKKTDGTLQERKAIYLSLQEEIDNSAAFVSSLKLKRGFLAPSLALFCLVIFRIQHGDKANEFMTALVTGELMAKEDPIMRCREHLQKPRTKGRGLATITILAYIFKAWNLHLAGKKNIGLLTLRHPAEVDELLKNASFAYGANDAPAV